VNSPTFLFFLIVALILSPRTQYGSIVLTNADSEVFKAAVEAGGLVEFSFDGTILLTNTVRVQKAVTIDATGRRIVIDGGKINRIFRIETNAVLVARNLTIRNAYASSLDPVPSGLASYDSLGGALFNDGGRVAFTDCTFRDNAATGRVSVPVLVAGVGGGGDIYTRGGTLSLSRCTFQNTFTEGGHGIGTSYASGGSLFIENSLVTVRDCRYLGCVAADTSGGLAPGLTRGGAIFLDTGTLQLIGTTFLRNYTWLPGRDYYAMFHHGFGGAVFNQGGNLMVAECRFEENSPTNKSDALLFSGAIHSSGRLVMSNTYVLNHQFGAIQTTEPARFSGCTFEGNSVEGRAAHDEGINYIPGAAGFGGAVRARTNVDFVNCTFRTNRAIGAPSVAYAGTGPGQYTPPAPGFGGAVYISSGIATFDFCTFGENTAIGGKGVIDPDAPGLGYAIAAGTNAVIVIRSSIIASPPLATTNSSIIEGTVTDLGNNLVSGFVPALNSPSSRQNTNPKLGVFSLWGGPTPTFSLNGDSPAINSGAPNSFPAFDQRGAPRSDARSDIGAFERPNNSIQAWLGSLGVSFYFASEPGTAGIIESSSDLKDWKQFTPETVTADGLFVGFGHPDPGNPLYLRLRRK
jgi:hypothetical protein